MKERKKRRGGKKRKTRKEKGLSIGNLQFLEQIASFFRGACGLMDKALVFSTKDCRFESCQDHFHFLLSSFFLLLLLLSYSCPWPFFFFLLLVLSSASFILFCGFLSSPLLFLPFPLNDPLLFGFFFLGGLL